MSQLLEIAFLRTWWRYAPGESPWFTNFYHSLNIAEGMAWIVFAVLVMRRCLIHRNSRWEVWYGLAFVTFAMTDFREAWELTSWLIWLKLVNLVALFLLRRVIMSRYYPNAKVY